MAEITTILGALKVWAVEKGVEPEMLNDDTSDTILAIAGAEAFASSNVTPASPTASKEYWGTKVSDMQSDVTVANGAITGLKEDAIYL